MKSRLNTDICSADSSIVNRVWSCSQSVAEPASDLNKCLDRLFSPALSPARQSHTQVLFSSSPFAFTVNAPSPEMICWSESCREAQAQSTFLRCSETSNHSRCLKGKDSSSDRRVSENLGNLQTIRQGRPGMMIVALFVFILALNVAQSQSRSVGLCRGVPCANGGRLLVDNSVWGHCRCRCRSGFVGPYCQYVLAEKRSSESTTSVDERRLSRPDALDRIRMRLLDLSQRLASYQASSNGTAVATPGVRDSPPGYADEGEMRSVLNNEELGMESSQYHRIRPFWFSTYFRR
ncbi:unnamed protein product [Candidula unifasciata]|uniref:EGF-like domain-containing protein n=1 Tax=Candidula unifasciata TaxID=100452 RepID=A0A8S3YK01_9EUPU|nr:unnamed protein product [Candidula unifasciata]